MINTECAPENFLQSQDNLRGQCDLWQQIQNLIAAFQRALNQVDVDFSLAASGNSMQEYGILLLKEFNDGIPHFLLMFAQKHGMLLMRIIKSKSRNGNFKFFEDFIFDHCANDRIGSFFAYQRG